MDFSQIIPALPGLWDGMLVTLQLMVLGVLGGVVLGTLLALMRLSHSKLLSNIAATYVNYFRSIPLLLVITWFYFAVPFILRWITGEDTPVGAFSSCLVAFVMFEAAYFCEIVRAGIQAIPKGQMEAAQSIGMGWGLAMRRVVLPQALKIALPPLLGQYMNVIKNSSLTMAIGVAELSYASRQVETETLRTFQAFGVATVLYIAIIALLEGWGMWRQQRKPLGGH